LSIKANLFVNTISQFYMALLSILTLPIYINLLGSSAYGLIAFFLQMQTLISLLDVGVSATVSRSTTLFCANQLDTCEYRKTIRGIELLFFFISLPVAMAGVFAESIALKWLNLAGFDSDVAIEAIMLMFIVIAFRWLQTYYRAIVIGAEKFVWLGWFNILISTFRIVGVIPYLYSTSGSVIDFFYYQMVLNLIELVVLFLFSENISGMNFRLRISRVSYTALLLALKNSFFIGLTSLVWAVIAQADKFLASGFLKLEDYTAYSLVITVSSVMILLSSPLIYPIGPAMARMLALNNKAEAIQLFRKISLAVSIILGAGTAVLIGWGYEVLYVWTGNPELSIKSYSYLPLYIIASLLFALSYLSYAINFAIGDFSKRLKYSIVALVIYLPILTIAFHFKDEFGLIYSWLLVNLGFFFIAQKNLYKQLDSDIYLESLLHDILIPVAACMLILPFRYLIDLSGCGKIQVFIMCFFIFLCSLFFGILLSNARNYAKSIIVR
jgi:O-antigen/teichoic acid export membrane protein